MLSPDTPVQPATLLLRLVASRTHAGTNYKPLLFRKQKQSGLRSVQFSVAGTQHHSVRFNYN